MDAGEKTIRQEDCNEDTLGIGILTLTNKRVAFDKTRSRMLDLSKRFGDTVLDVGLGDIENAWTEGWLIKKVCITARLDGGQKTFKFGVMSTGSWLESITGALDSV